MRNRLSSVMLWLCAHAPLDTIDDVVDVPGEPPHPGERRDALCEDLCRVEAGDESLGTNDIRRHSGDDPHRLVGAIDEPRRAGQNQQQNDRGCAE
jgi:hypothetical protein